MSHAVDSKTAQAYLIDPMRAPEPSQETGPGAHFGSTFAPATTSQSSSSTHTRTSSNPYSKGSPLGKNGVKTAVRGSSGSPKERFPDYRADAFRDVDPSRDSRRRAGSQGTPPSYREATSDSNTPAGSGRRRGSSLRERYPGDDSHKPLDIIRRDSKKARRSPHLHKRSIPGADQIDRLDPAIGGHSYHHEGPYDAALMSRNRNPKTAPLSALERSNQEALKATPKENIKNAVERHQPLDGVADVPPGQPDRFGRTYNYEEGADLMREGGSDAGYKRWPGKDYDAADLKGESEPTFSLDRALRAHKIDENSNGGIELQDRAHLMSDYDKSARKGTLDPRDPVEIAGDDGKYADMEIANAEASGSGGISRPRASSHNIKEGLKKRIGSLRHRKDNDN